MLETALFFDNLARKKLIIECKNVSFAKTLDIQHSETLKGKVNTFNRIHGIVNHLPPFWYEITALGYTKLLDIKYFKTFEDGIAKVVIDRPFRRNAFRPRTIQEISMCLSDVRDDHHIGVVILTGEGIEAFCSGGDQDSRNQGGYIDESGIPRLNVLDLQVQIRRLPKPIVAMIAGYAVGGGQILQMICDISIAASNAIFGQTGPKVGSFDAGFGVSMLTRLVGQKKAREMWFLTKMYNARDALLMNLVNVIVSVHNLEYVTFLWSREMIRNSPMALRILKSALNACEDGHMGLQQFGGDATLLFYHSEEGNEGKESFIEKRTPNFSRFKKLP